MPRPALCCTTPPHDGVTNPARAHDKRDHRLVAGRVLWAKLTQPQQDAVLLAARKGHEGPEAGRGWGADNQDWGMDQWGMDQWDQLMRAPAVAGGRN